MAIGDVVTYKKLSASSFGKAVLVVATSTPGTTVHTAVTGTTNLDKLFLYAVNNHTAAVAVTVEFGAVTDPTNVWTKTISADDGPYLICPGFPLQNSLSVAVFAGTANKVSIYGEIWTVSAT